jgi:D-methionine transport system permease protein
MMELIHGFIPNLERTGEFLLQSFFQTLQMVFGSGAISFVLGIFFGVALVVMRRGGILENIILYNVLDKVINIIRSVSFLILIILLRPFSRMIMGTSIGVAGAIVPLVIGTVPFFSRQVETVVSEVGDGLVEASMAMGMTPMQIIWRVYLRESIPGLARVTQITAINLINLATLAGAIGAGGLGDFALRFGHQHRMRDMMWLTIIIILILVSMIQGAGNIIIKKTTK